MNTPVIDYVNQYINSGTVRMHMPGHKGTELTGPEKADITEICGAGELYESSGPIGEAEENTAALFGAGKSCWVTEGSSQCIRAMVALAALNCGKKGGTIIAARNAHRAFVTGCALAGIRIEWLWSRENYSLCSCRISAGQVEDAIEASAEKPAAVWLTSPDYLGNLQDISGIAAVCRRHDVPLLVDNAHGAYLKFMHPSVHPLDLGADMCCDSAHKTLPALTGCAYLHISKTAPVCFAREAKRMLALTGSTSPSWLLLQSLDAVNRQLAGDFTARLDECINKTAALKAELEGIGWRFIGDETIKLTVDAGRCGYSGPQLAELLRQKGVECEYADPDYVVLMVSVCSTDGDLETLRKSMREIPVLPAMQKKIFSFAVPEKVFTPAGVMLMPAVTVKTEDAVGRILADSSLSCPPAVPVITAGERIGRDMLPVLEHYGIEEVSVAAE